MRFCVPLGATQPTVGVGTPFASREFLQFCIKPGILPAMEVIWKVEIVSNNHPYPTLTAVFASGDQAMPTRGPIAPRLLVLYQRSDRPNVTGPCEPSMGRFGTRVCLESNGGGLIYHRKPPFRTIFGVMCQSS